MTVNTTESQKSFDGNDIATEFSFDFPFSKKEDIVVVLYDADGAGTTQVLNSDYTIPGVSWINGGQVTMVTAPEIGEKLIVSRIIDIIQSAGFRNLGDFRAEVHEDTFDKIIMILQQQQSQIDRSIKVSDNQDTLSYDELIEEIDQKDASVLSSANLYTDQAVFNAGTVTPESVNRGDEQVSGLSIHPKNITQTASVGDDIVIASTALRDAVNSKIYFTSEEVIGTITAIDFALGTATIGGVSVSLTYFSVYLESDEIRKEKQQGLNAYPESINLSSVTGDIVDSGTNALRINGGDFNEITLFPIVSQTGVKKSFDGEITAINLIIKPYTATIGGDLVYLLDSRHYSKFFTSVRSFWASTDGVNDDAIAVNAAMQSLSGCGGRLYFTEPDVSWLWNSPVTVLSTKKIIIDSCGVNIQIGDSFTLGGANQLTYFLTVEGGAPEEFTSTNINSFYGNFMNTSDSVSAKKGDRFITCNDDPLAKWNVTDNNCRPTTISRVDYMDEENDIVNFYPPIDWAPTILNESTGQFDDTHINAYLYNQDVELTIKTGIRFIGNLLPIGVAPITGGQSAGGASTYGMYLSRGKFKIESDFLHINGCIRQNESELKYSGDMRGGYNGNGLNVFQRSLCKAINSGITGFRHSVSVGGSTSDGASFKASNTTLGSARTSFNSNTYPSEEFRAFDTHQAAKDVELSNCTLYGGAVISNGNVRVKGGKIFGTQSQGFVRFKTDSANDQSIVLDGVRFIHPRRIPAFDYASAEGVTPGAGTAATDTFFFRDYENSPEVADVTGWTFDCINCTFEFEDENSYVAPGVVQCQVGSKLWKRVNFSGCKFYLKGTSMREVNFTGRSASDDENIGTYRVNCEFYGAGASFDRDNSGLNIFQTIDFSGSDIKNTDEGTGTFANYGLFIEGDDSENGKTLHVFANDVKVRSYGISGGIFIGDFPIESVSVDNYHLTFTRAATVGVGVSTNRNQNVDTYGQHVCTVRNGTMQKNPLGNITTGIRIDGLAADGTLPVGFYATSGNAIRTAVAPLVTTGQGLTLV